ncbi:putative ribosomal Rna (adenine(1779)-N(6)/adenine(1780)-N(6))- dimethyltransferase [Cardiosporidium cionae]|uniref:rRNA adenine N(6)-methyltransferase n=1 Tax=Cardiosporidium cionae TaxID=476202 RepID=A0ABQ7JG48_9APIC|nr:putative ribosomal Rna (adenine(1779)-N(6)/adenine(1780)-N(6))- dimethyltransferase [Cardiosporidium cionae]|eukprot:KAF8823010.1 putative ribosomal Rna (adenine(1779)-N(6)/adenine(1780)-N(6))- dimethyltransferase [Cardiosporidium cionae]
MAMRRGRSTFRCSPTSNSGPPTIGLQLHKRFGQHMLKNPGILDKIVSAADIKSSETVLEIGPGTGNLTVRLLPLAKKVRVIDIDERMVNEVKKRAFALGHTNLEVLQGDALRTDFGRFDICTANLPYQISSPFIFRLLAHRPSFRCAVLMFQKEFAERLLAEPNEKNYGRLAINVRLFCKVSRVCKVSAGSFNPAPQVDSMIVKLTPRNPPLQVDFQEWDGLMRICFSCKRKTLNAVFNRNAVLNMLESNYKTWCSLNKEKPTLQPFKQFCLSILEDVGLARYRSINIEIDSFFQLLLAFNCKGIHFVNVAQKADKNLTASRGDFIDDFSECEDGL